MTLSRIKRYIPQCVGYLILLKGLVNLTSGIFAFFWTNQIAMLHEVNVLVLFWDFTPVKALTAIVMGISYIFLGRGLYQGKRLAWQVALFFLVLNLLDSLIPRVVIFQVLYALVMFALLWTCRDYFNKKTKNIMRPQQLIAFFSITFALAYGVVGCYLLRAQYQGISSWVDAIYYSLETYSTIGYGDIVPITTNARIFTCTMIILGVGSFVTAVSILLGPAMEQRMKKVVNMVNKLSVAKNHVIVVGATALGLHTARILQNQGTSVIVLDPNPEALKLAQNANFKVIVGEADRETILETANIKTASALVCVLNSDAQNLLATMVANTMRQASKLKLKIITRIDEPQNIDYATKNGADEVISPSVILGEMVAKTLATPSASKSIPTTAP